MSLTTGHQRSESNRGVMMHVKVGAEVIFNERCVILRKDGETVVTAYMRDNLYVTEIAVRRVNTSLTEADSANLWHQRLGHISESEIATLMCKTLVLGVYFKPKKIKPLPRYRFNEERSTT